MGNPTCSPSQMGTFPFGSNGFGYTSRKPDIEGFSFGSPTLELPSNQYSQNMGGNYAEMRDDDQVKFDKKYVGQTNSGLLDELLQEAQVKVGFKRDREKDCGVQWDVSSSENSCTGLKKADSEDQQLNIDSQDFSNILESIPSLVQVPSWCNDGGAESSAAQSSAVSTDDNYNGFDDQMAQPPSFTADITTNYDDDGNWNPECYSWD